MSDIAEFITEPLFIKKCSYVRTVHKSRQQRTVHDVGHMVSEVSQSIASSSYKGKAS